MPSASTSTSSPLLTSARQGDADPSRVGPVPLSRDHRQAEEPRVAPGGAPPGPDRRQRRGLAMCGRGVSFLSPNGIRGLPQVTARHGLGGPPHAGGRGKRWSRRRPASVDPATVVVSDTVVLRGPIGSGAGIGACAIPWGGRVHRNSTADPARRVPAATSRPPGGHRFRSHDPMGKAVHMLRDRQPLTPHTPHAPRGSVTLPALPHIRIIHSSRAMRGSLRPTSR